MKKALIPALVTGIMLSGCYNMTDIENIETVTTVCVEPGKMTYCTVTTTPGEKDYGYRLYTEETEDLYRGLNSVALKTGKEISVSHLNSVLFSKKCDLKTIRAVCESAVKEKEFHPKIMTGFTDMDFEDFFEKMSVPEDTIMYRHLADVLCNKYATVTEATITGLYRALKWQGLGVNLPVFTLDDEGNITAEGICHINRDKAFPVSPELTQTVNLLENPGKTVFYIIEDKSVGVRCTDRECEFSPEENHMLLSLEVSIMTGGRPADRETAGKTKKRIISDMIKICNEKNNGCDIPGLWREIPGKFFTEKELSAYLDEKGGLFHMLRQMDFDIEVRAEGEI